MLNNPLIWLKIRKRVKFLNNKLLQSREEYIRLLADYDNYKKDVQRRINEAKESEREKLFKEIIIIVDNFERALDYINKFEGNEELKRGIEMIYKQLMKFLNDNGIEQVSLKGKPFDPRLCEVLMVKEGEMDNYIIEEFEKAYLYKGKLLKPARVVVSKKITS
ncbi:MAG: nucleotide exchange factor GrpE [candidate division WOR-3 bacterium]|jgi:molecular chaperone GrpE